VVRIARGSSVTGPRPSLPSTGGQAARGRRREASSGDRRALAAWLPGIAAAAPCGPPASAPRWKSRVQHPGERLRLDRAPPRRSCGWGPNTMGRPAPACGKARRRTGRPKAGRAPRRARPPRYRPAARRPTGPVRNYPAGPYRSAGCRAPERPAGRGTAPARTGSPGSCPAGRSAPRVRGRRGGSGPRGSAHPPAVRVRRRRRRACSPSPRSSPRRPIRRRRRG